MCHHISTGLYKGWLCTIYWNILRVLKDMQFTGLFILLDSSLNVTAHGDAQEGKWRGNWRMQWVASTTSHYLGTWCIQHYYRWCAHLGCQQSTELTPPPADLNGLVRFNEKRKLVSARVPSHFNWPQPIDTASHPEDFNASIRKSKLNDYGKAIFYSHVEYTCMQSVVHQTHVVTGQYLYCCDNTGLFKMTVEVLTTCHTQHTSDSSICVFLFNRTTLQVSVAYLTGALYVHPLWFYKQH